MYSKNKEGSVNRNFTVVLMWKLGNVERTTEEFYYFITSPWSSHLNQLDPLILFSPIHFPAFLLPPSAWTEMVSSVSVRTPCLLWGPYHSRVPPCPLPFPQQEARALHQASLGSNCLHGHQLSSTYNLASSAVWQGHPRDSVPHTIL